MLRAASQWGAGDMGGSVAVTVLLEMGDVEGNVPQGDRRHQGPWPTGHRMSRTMVPMGGMLMIVFVWDGGQ